jgi:hypothetical protein
MECVFGRSNEDIIRMHAEYAFLFFRPSLRYFVSFRAESKRDPSRPETPNPIMHKDYSSQQKGVMHFARTQHKLLPLD